MKQNLSPIISTEELVRLKQITPIVLIDASAGLDSKEKYKQQL